MSDPHHPAVPPLDAADPRISEWLDGRLPAAEAAAVERAVGESPELMTLVADLKKIRVGLKRLPAPALPADFSDRVIERVRAAGRPAADAQPAGAAGRGRSRQRLPWAVLATALAAGLLVAVVLNLSEPADRQVAMAPTADDELDVWLPPEQEAARAGLRPPAPAPEAVASAAMQDRSAITAAADANAAAAMRIEANEFAVEFAADETAEQAARPTADALASAPARKAVPPPAARLRQLPPPAVPIGLVVIAIDGPDERLAIERLVTASGLEVADVDGRIELTGRAAAIDAFLARLSRDGWVATAPEARRQAAGESATRNRARESERDAARTAGTTDRRQLILRLVDRRPPPQSAAPKAAAEPDQP
jgi:hypothetical protein